MQIIEAKLSDLKIDPSNVRQTDKAPDEGLLASIREKGLLVPLTVRKNGAGYLVTDGGMRLQALHILARDGDYDKAAPVPCILREDDEAAAADTSLTTNYIRTAMHPVDEFEAFAKLVDAGKTPEAIAKDYGLSAKSVKQSLALGRLAPEVRAAWRKGDLDEDEAGAFTLETDLKRQVAILKKVGKHTSCHEIRGEILGESHQTAGLLRLVGIEAYKTAGGATTEDLFTHENNPELVATDLKLLKKLADEKIATTIERLKGEGWKWVSDGSDLPDGARWWASLPKGQITAGDREKYGVIVGQQHNGEIEIKYGVQKPSEKKATEKKKAVAKGEAAAPMISAALAGRISAQITTAAESVLALDSNLGLAAIAAALTSEDGPVCIQHNRGEDDSEFAEQLAMFRKKPVDQLIRILAGLAASALDLGGSVQHMLPLAEDRDEDRALLEALDAKKLNAELRASFDAADYFAGVTAQACKEAIALCDPKQPITGKEKKSELAKLATDLVKKSNAGGKAGYLPPEMRTSKYDGPKAAKPVAKAKAAKKKAR
jgi:ParB family chromosome partitioning protein